MKILVGIWHPGHVHFFKNFIWEMERRGHEIKIIILEKEMNKKLLDIYGFTYESIGKNELGLLKKLKNTIIFDMKVYRIAKEFRPDIMVGIAAIFFSHIGKLLNIPSIIFTDSETSGLINTLTFPFADVICTPECYLDNLGKKQVRYAGYHELAYLHPNTFQPHKEILEKLNLSIHDRFFIIRFISWGASHDIGLKGLKGTHDLITFFESYGKIFITSERNLPPELEKFRLNIPPEEIHSLLYYSDLYFGEGGTMAAEAAIIGTPAIHVEATAEGVATGNLSGNFRELHDRYGLLYFFADQKEAILKVTEILENRNAKQEWQKKRENLLKDKVDVTAWMTDFVENYPESFYQYKKDNLALK